MLITAEASDGTQGSLSARRERLKAMKELQVCTPTMELTGSCGLLRSLSADSCAWMLALVPPRWILEIPQQLPASPLSRG